MECYNCSDNGKGICIIEVIISIIAGVLVGVLFSNSVITALTGFVAVALIVSAIGLAILLGSLAISSVSGACNEFKKCICKNGTCLLVASLGGLIAGTVAVILNIAVVSIATTLAIAFTTFFFVWVILSIFSLILCLIKETCR